MTVLLFIAVLLLLIIGHEFGHFIVAKLSGMRVDEFGVGFPPKIFGKKIGETEYTVNWLPFGGFVKIFGEDENDKEDPRAFANRHPLHQAAVLFAGPFANVFMAVVLSSIAFMIGSQALINETNSASLIGEPRVLVGAVLPESPAEVAGIQVGDEIKVIRVGLEAHLIASADEVSTRIAEASGPVTLTLIRNGEVQQIEVEATAGVDQSEPERKIIGIATALVGEVAYPVHQAVLKGLQVTGENFVYISISLLTLIKDAFTLSADVSNLAGPIGIASLTGEAAAFGLGSLLSFAALLSINLAIINLLPFPALDGGRLFFLALETLFRRKIPTPIFQMVNAGGFFVLILLMVAVTIGDVTRLFG